MWERQRHTQTCKIQREDVQTLLGTEEKQHVFTIKEDFTEKMTCEMDLEG